MKTTLPGIVKVEKDTVWRVFYFNPRLLAQARPLEILAELENDLASKQGPDIPTPESMGSTVELLPNIRTPGVTQDTLDQLSVSRVWHDTKNPEIQPLEDSCLLAFPRYHLSMHPASRVNQALHGLRNPVEYEAHTLSTSKFHILLKELDIQVFQDLSSLLRDEKYLTSGASFDISVAIARSNSQFQPFSDGTARPRWIGGSVVALKRLKPPRTRPGIRESIQFPRIHRSLIHELRILSHASLRNHRNLINLFGIAWERHHDVSGIDYMRPVVVQSCATRGNLRDYLRAKTDDKELPWRTKMLFCKDILDGLAFLHASNVIHGDIKCDNILLEEDSNTQLVAKLTDFGFSIIVPLSVSAAPILEVEMLSGTEAYMAPEVYIAKQNGTTTLSTSVAFSSDIYAFGLTACEIALNGRYVFSALLSPSETPEVTPSADQDSESAEAWIKSKIRDNADDLLLRPLKTLIDHMEGTDEYRLSEVLDITFRRRAEDRATDIATIRSVVVGYDEEATIPTVGSPISLDKSSNSSLSFLFKQRYEIFNVNGQPVQLRVHDVSVSVLRKLDSALSSQILEDLKVKASPAVSLQTTNVHKMNTLSLGDVASVSFCAYQMFICHLHGYGVPFDLEMAVQYLKASAHGGYVPALVAVSNFRDLKADPLFARNDRIQDALEAQVSIGPRFGILLWLVACRTLRRDNLEAYQRGFKKLNSSGYAELGEAPDCYTQLDAETFGGPSVEYQWVARGTMPLVLRLLPILSVQEFTTCFNNGCFPSGAVNYNNETALYMCCRAGEKEKVLALLDTYEWARAEVTVANRQGRFPLHWLWAFERDDAQAVAEALLSHGADVDAIDEDGFRAIDYAIVAHCPDVVSLLLTKMINIFKGPERLGKDLLTLIRAINCGEPTTAIELLQKAGAEIVEKAFRGAAQGEATSRVLQFGNAFQERLVSLIKAATRHVGPTNSPTSMFETVLIVAIAARSVDFVEALLDAQVVPQFSSAKWSTVALASAAEWSQLDVFKKILKISAPLSLDDAHTVLGLAIQYKGHSQLAIALAFIEYLDECGTIKEVVNYRVPSACPPFCDIKHDHFFYPTQFWNAVDEGAHDIANILASY
ncbi:uncharacterized protein Z519_09320 [Cladophialophora bantiana CBS 173.52]|uniref:Serine/threonine-protein kinase ATG1 n=1 Tax=Cladophialophora bantiana (strain ATCC 10958 / CBS 173.52 / CDC B-1940 / NIH 8579) TaxID=1442370 RepID=A0A0D2EIK1_CLAB1|nr:uncharacterized protein Z519_09320 [Cladophialophora bantiana CBS 173.52]KIW89891.1 hypothetical protein Z519_09320 [Cladophialophora bantiana CBS 173.52]